MTARKAIAGLFVALTFSGALVIDGEYVVAALCGAWAVVFAAIAWWKIKRTPRTDVP